MRPRASGLHCCLRGVLLDVLHLHDVPAVRDVRFFATAGRGPGAVVRLVAAQDAQAVLSAKQRLPGRSCVVSIDVSRGAAQRSLRARERCASRAVLRPSRLKTLSLVVVVFRNTEGVRLDVYIQ